MADFSADQLAESQSVQRTFGSVAGFSLPEEIQNTVNMVQRGKLTDPRIKAAIQSLRGSGVPIRKVCEALKVSAHTVLAAEKEDPELMATLKERAAETWELASVACAEGLLEAAITGKLKPNEMGLSGGIAQSKAIEARGGIAPAQVVEVRLTLDDAKAQQASLVERLRSKAAVIDVEVVQ